MNANIFLQKTSNLFIENRLLKFTLVVLAITVIFNSFMVYRSIKYQRVILVPPNMQSKIEFIQGKPSEQYLREMSRYIVNLATTYSPPTARKQFEELLFYFSPESYPEASEAWYSLAGRVEESQVSSVFYPEKVRKRKSSIEIFGNLRQFAGNTELDNSSKTFLIDYRLQNGRFYLISFQEKLAPSMEEDK